MTAVTRTGKFGIGFRRGWSDWQKDLGALVKWAKANEFACVDLGRDADQVGAVVCDAGLTVGSADLAEWEPMMSADAAERKAAVAKNAAYIEACAKLGISNHFIVLMPKDASLSPDENMGYAIEAYGELAPVFEAHQAKLVIEGYPGPGALACTAEGLRLFFAGVDSEAMGVNYDPSHLIRLGVDHMAFLREFGQRVFHVHAKDTERFPEAVAACGTGHGVVHASSHGFGAHDWRYTLPGHGEARWVRIFEHLAQLGYEGQVSIELEDENFNGSESGEKEGFLLSRDYLRGC